MGGRVARVARVVPVLFGVAFGVSLLFPAAPAAAHNSLTGSDPANGARVATAPTRIELRFLARADPATTKVTITGPDNVAAAGGAPTFAGSRVSVPFRPGRAGLYIVEYRVPSDDGHPVTGEVRFTLTTGTAAQPPSPAPTGVPAPTTSAADPTASTAGPSSAAPSGAPTGPDATNGVGSPVPAGRENTTSETSRGWLWLVAVVVVLGAVAAGLLLRRRARRT